MTAEVDRRTALKLLGLAGTSVVLGGCGVDLIRSTDTQGNVEQPMDNSKFYKMYQAPLIQHWEDTARATFSFLATYHKGESVMPSWNLSGIKNLGEPKRIILNGVPLPASADLATETQEMWTALKETADNVSSATSYFSMHLNSDHRDELEQILANYPGAASALPLTKTPLVTCMAQLLTEDQVSADVAVRWPGMGENSTIEYRLSTNQLVVSREGETVVTDVAPEEKQLLTSVIDNYCPASFLEAADR